MTPENTRPRESSGGRVFAERRAAHVRQLLTGDDTGFSAAVDELVLLGKDKKEREEFITRLLLGPSPAESKAKILRVQILNRQSDLEGDLLGALLFWLFGASADRGDYDTANELLRRRQLTDFIFAKHEVDKAYHYVDLELHRAGTTSFILKSSANAKVLKILRWKVMSNPDITLQTEMYADEYKDARYSPSVAKSGKYYVVMDYVDGKTLAEFAKARIGAATNSGRENSGVAMVRLTILIKVSQLLCNALAYYAEPPRQRQHLDLSPDNVLILEGNGDLSIRLIDFGFNSALKEGVTSAKRVVRAQRYIDPALLDNLDADTSQADIYSLGVMLLDLLTSNELTPSAALDHVWRSYPHFAPLIEDMIDKSGENRLVLMGPSRSKPEKYLLVQRRLELEAQTELLVRKTAEQAPRWQKILSSFYPTDAIGFIQEGWSRWVGSKEAAASLESNSPELATAWRARTSDARRLVWHAGLASFFDWFTLAAGVVLIWGDLSLHVTLANLLDWQFHWGELVAAWPIIKARVPGRLVAMTFSLIASRFYLNLYSRMAVRQLSRFTDLMLRSLSWLIYVPFIVGTLFMPQWWAWLSGTGALLVASVNWLCYSLAAQGQDTKTDFDLPPTGTTVNFDGDFGNWGPGMAVYGVLLLFIGWLVWVGWANDGHIYALLTCAVNLWTYYGVCLKRAPIARANCLRYFSRLERRQARQALP
jgi:serine/threonine protein kinase